VEAIDNKEYYSILEMLCELIRNSMKKKEEHRNEGG
jgi:hypothetical protein